MPPQLQQVYASLGEILEHPQSFGLGQHVPRLLAERLESIRRMLQEGMSEVEEEEPDGDLAAELSEDADDRSVRHES